ncbi:DoxX family protein [Psychroflexus sediminis]|uniref:DoxX-like family protein n=1 Tax=Psychroflexus sediminis TaxID=470826 RepID=A0A1G7VBY9_9FLAO|nr:DoxX family protein [Psychroflexus sediminis]SDG57068.1 DoxX-like family protein [Psychroflexus sediminis]
MDTLILIFKVVIALGILNVWLLRFNKQTEWRGAGAGNMNEEFTKYGLPVWLVPVIGFLKLGFATLLIISIFQDGYNLGFIGAVGMGILMIGAIAMHIKINDPLKRSLPAFLMLVMSAFIAFA